MCLLPHVLGNRLWWGSPCQGLHPCHSGGLRELQRAHTPLRRSAFQHELKKHPDKAWVSWLLKHPDKAWVSWLLQHPDKAWVSWLLKHPDKAWVSWLLQHPDKAWVSWLLKHPDKAWVSWLLQHPDKAWVSWLLNGIDNGVSTGYNGPHFPFTARNLRTTAPPKIVDAKLEKEVNLGRILQMSLFPAPPQAPPHIRAQSCPKEKWQVESDPSLVSTRGS